MSWYEIEALKILKEKKLLTRMQWYDLFNVKFNISWHLFKFKVVQNLVLKEKIGKVKDYYYLNREQ